MLKKEFIIKAPERFDFSLHQIFRDSYINVESHNKVLVLDLSLTSYMDSSALGMILLLKEHADNVSASVIIRKPNATVNKILEIAQFHRLFIIEN
ncbi:STAS domain-containing protein [Pseudocolwellia agarivorans]|uniref:STAS domain-containing protein n=1 Tax=Pseudocolwellia agarivorans TaxID=1911682 RepID=UPI0009874C89|nr:STAS domain-containing protein [Pseudocolwellia agarivorans]